MNRAMKAMGCVGRAGSVAVLVTMCAGVAGGDLVEVWVVGAADGAPADRGADSTPAMILADIRAEISRAQSGRGRSEPGMTEEERRADAIAWRERVAWERSDLVAEFGAALDGEPGFVVSMRSPDYAALVEVWAWTMRGAVGAMRGGAERDALDRVVVLERAGRVMAGAAAPSALVSACWGHRIAPQWVGMVGLDSGALSREGAAELADAIDRALMEVGAEIRGTLAEFAERWPERAIAESIEADCAQATYELARAPMPLDAPRERAALEESPPAEDEAVFASAWTDGVRSGLRVYAAAFAEMWDRADASDSMASLVASQAEPVRSALESLMRANALYHEWRASAVGTRDRLRAHADGGAER